MTTDPTERIFVIDGINPEPWVASEGSVGRKGGKTFVMFHKPAGLRAYQEAIQEEFRSRYPDLEPIPAGQPIMLEFHFSRELPQYEGEKGKVRRHVADMTNLQKALEDALQGILFKNDRDVKIIKSIEVEQEFDTAPRILIIVTSPPPAVEFEWAKRLAAGQSRVRPQERSPYDRPEVTEF